MHTARPHQRSMASLFARRSSLRMRVDMVYLWAHIWVFHLRNAACVRGSVWVFSVHDHLPIKNPVLSVMSKVANYRTSIMAFPCAENLCTCTFLPGNEVLANCTGANHLNKAPLHFFKKGVYCSWKSVSYIMHLGPSKKIAVSTTHCLVFAKLSKYRWGYQISTRGQGHRTPEHCPYRHRLCLYGHNSVTDFKPHDTKMYVYCYFLLNFCPIMQHLNWP